MKLEDIHRSGILDNIRTVLVDDLISSINIVNERVGAPCKPIRSDFVTSSIIDLYSYVDHTHIAFIKIDLVLTKYEGKLYPALMLQNIIAVSTCNYILDSIDLEELMNIKKNKHSFMIRGKKIKKLILDNTHTERVTLLELVADMFERAARVNYSIGGIMNIREVGSNLI